MTEAKPRIAKQKKASNYYIDLGVALDDDLLIGKEFVDYLKTNLKVHEKKGNLGDKVSIVLEKKRVTVSFKNDLQKRYLKYLTKKYLKKVDILEYLRLVATDKQTYAVKYIRLGGNDENQAEE